MIFFFITFLLIFLFYGNLISVFCLSLMRRKINNQHQDRALKFSLKQIKRKRKAVPKYTSVREKMPTKQIRPQMLPREGVHSRTKPSAKLTKKRQVRRTKLNKEKLVPVLETKDLQNKTKIRQLR